MIYTLFFMIHNKMTKTQINVGMNCSWFTLYYQLVSMAGASTPVNQNRHQSNTRQFFVISYHLKKNGVYEYFLLFFLAKNLTDLIH